LLCIVALAAGCKAGYGVFLRPISEAGDDTALVAKLDAVAKADGFSLRLVAPYPGGGGFTATYGKKFSDRPYDDVRMMISYDDDKIANRMPVQVTILNPVRTDGPMRAEIDAVASKCRNAMERYFGKGTVEVTSSSVGQEW
jgi:hypothetical protein